MEVVIALFIAWAFKKIFDLSLQGLVLIFENGRQKLPYVLIQRGKLYDLEMKARSLKVLTAAISELPVDSSHKVPPNQELAKWPH